jgi:hypothetical protein
MGLLKKERGFKTIMKIQESVIFLDRVSVDVEFRDLGGKMGNNARGYKWAVIWI